MATIIEGKALAKKIRENLKIECEELRKQGVKPRLAVIMVGDNPASKVYVKSKNKACNEIGIDYEEHLLEETITQEQLNGLIKELNNKEEVNGILLQSPLPRRIPSAPP